MEKRKASILLVEKIVLVKIGGYQMNKEELLTLKLKIAKEEHKKLLIEKDIIQSTLNIYKEFDKYKRLEK